MECQFTQRGDVLHGGRRRSNDAPSRKLVKSRMLFILFLFSLYGLIRRAESNKMEVMHSGVFQYRCKNGHSGGRSTTPESSSHHHSVLVTSLIITLSWAYMHLLFGLVS